MNRLIVIIVLFLQLDSTAQLCSSFSTISIDSLIFDECTGECCYKLKPIHLTQLQFHKGYDSIQLFNERNQVLETIAFRNTNLGEDFAETGICFCATCQQAKHNMSLKKDSIYFLKVFGKKQLEFSVNKKYSDDLPWYERALTSGTVIDLETILFVGGLATFLPSSYSDLSKLEQILTANPTMCIKVMGHVNGPGLPNTRKNQRLSDERAEAVVNYLVSKGIDKGRLTSAGYGNTKMVYPNPKSDFEMRRNRRVEILIK